MSLVPSLLNAILRLDGEALVMHVGEKPYVVAPSGQVELASRPLNFDAVSGMVAQLLPTELQRTLDDFGAVQYEFPTVPEFPGEQFSVIAARGGEDVWVEVRRRRVPEDDNVPEELFAAGSAAAEPVPTVDPEWRPTPSIDTYPGDNLSVPRPDELWSVAATSVDRTDELPEVEAALAASDWPESDDVDVQVDASFEVQATAEQATAEQIRDSEQDAADTVEMEDPPDISEQPVAGPAITAEPVSAALLFQSEWPSESSEHAWAVAPAETAFAGASHGAASAVAFAESAWPNGPSEVAPGAAIADSVLPVTANEATGGGGTHDPHPVAPAPAPFAVLAEPPTSIAPHPLLSAAPQPGPQMAGEWASVFLPAGPMQQIDSGDQTPSPRAFEADASVLRIPISVQMPIIPVAAPLKGAPVPLDSTTESAEAASATHASPNAAPPPRPSPTEVPSVAIGAAGCLNRLLRIAASRGASALYVASGTRPSVRVDGEIQQLTDEAALPAAEVEMILLDLMPEPNREELQREVESEWICDIAGVGRLRCITFRDHRGAGGIFRMMPVQAISADRLGLSREIQALAAEAEGLVLVAGPRSSGKSTLIAAFVDLINRTRHDHVITIENEIQIVHEQCNSLVSQREASAKETGALARTAVREHPDVLVIEELASAEIVTIALDAAASGHLVIGGVAAHTSGAAVDRIIDLYPPEQRGDVQLSLADTLRGIVAQVLVRKPAGGRIAAREVLLNTPAVASVIAEGRTSQLPQALEAGRRFGMVALNDVLAGLVQTGTVDTREAYRRAADRAGLLTLLQRRGIDTSFVLQVA